MIGMWWTDLHIKKKTKTKLSVIIIIIKIIKR